MPLLELGTCLFTVYMSFQVPRGRLSSAQAFRSMFPSLGLLPSSKFAWGCPNPWFPLPVQASTRGVTRQKYQECWFGNYTNGLNNCYCFLHHCLSPQASCRLLPSEHRAENGQRGTKELVPSLETFRPGEKPFSTRPQNDAGWLLYHSHFKDLKGEKSLGRGEVRRGIHEKERN